MEPKQAHNTAWVNQLTDLIPEPAAWAHGKHGQL